MKPLQRVAFIGSHPINRLAELLPWAATGDAQRRRLSRSPRAQGQRRIRDRSASAANVIFLFGRDCFSRPGRTDPRSTERKADSRTTAPSAVARRACP